MQNKHYELETILSTFTNYKNGKAKKMLIFDRKPLGAMSKKLLIGFFFLLPLLDYAGAFNPWMFNMLGLVSAIVFFIVFLSMVMIMVVALTFMNNNAVIREVTPSWEEYFPNIPLPMVLNSNSKAPYRDFFKHCGEALSQNLTGEVLHENLKGAFAQMADENQEILEAMNRKR